MKHWGVIGGIIVLFALNGCGGGISEAPTPTTPTFTVSPTPVPTPVPSPTPDAPQQVVSPKNKEALRELLLLAMEGMTAPPPLELSECLGEEEPEQALKNIYFDILAERPALKYAYDLTAEVAEDGLIRCTLSYMPYKLGAPGSAGVAIDSLPALITAAEDGLGGERMEIRIANPGLDVDDMSWALQQVGGGYLVCGLNQDATAIEYRPSQGYDMEECLTMLEEARAAAEALVLELTTPEMEAAERLTALYTWLTDTVQYDRRYYTDRDSLPFTATTATGALNDHLAICGGYAHALELLCKAAGLEVYTVSGRAANDYHMWNIVRVDGRWSYCDATFDRNTSRFGFRHFMVDAETLAADHQWDTDFIRRLTGEEE